MSIVNPFRREDMELAIDAVIAKLETRINTLLFRWLLPATAYTETSMFRFVLESLMTEDLVVDDAPFQCHISHEVYIIVDAYTSSPRNMFELELNSDEYKQRFALYQSLVPKVLTLVREFLTTAAQVFMTRAIDNATAPEAGLAAGLDNMFLVSLLYGAFHQTSSSLQTWEPHYSTDHEYTESFPVATGVLRIILMHVRQFRTSVANTPGAATAIGNTAARLLTDQLSQRYSDWTVDSYVGAYYTDVPGVVMHKTDELVKLVSRLFHCTAADARELIIANPAFAPNSHSGFVNVPFLIENVLFALERGTLNLPRLRSDFGRTTAKYWIRDKSRLCAGLRMAFTSEGGISMRRLQEFCASCNTTQRVFVHLTRCFHLILQGLMVHYKFTREEVEHLQTKLHNDIDMEILMQDREEPPDDSPWKGVVTYVGEDDVVFNMSVLVHRLVQLTVHGTATKTAWVRRPVFTPARRSLPLDHVPNEFGAWRVINTAFDLPTVFQTPRQPCTVFETTNAAPETLNIAYSRTLPTFQDIVYTLCFGKGAGTKEVTLSMLPTFVLLWNAGKCIRKQLRETAEPVTINKSKRRKRQRDTFTCEMCLEERPSQMAEMGCSHVMCDICASAMLESRIVDVFAGKGSDHSSCIGACPMPGCHGLLADVHIQALVAPEVFAGYAAIKARARPTRASCGDVDWPICSVCGTDAPDTFHASKEGAIFSCEACGAKTCSQCGTAPHLGTPCVRRVSGKSTPQDLLSAAKIQHCPTCKLPEVKRRNCNHLVCKACKTDWCWACGQVLPSTDTTTHYRDESPSCVVYSTQTETERMKRKLLAMETEEKDVVNGAIRLLEESLQQTDADI